MKSIRYILDWFVDPARRRQELVRPRSLNLPVTDNCNARCVMCDVWKENVRDDFSLEHLGEVLAEPFFQNLRHVGISGGEPFLRIDLPEIVEVICRLPQLRTISITSHGFNFVRHREFAPRIKKLTDDRGVRLSINLSIDGVGKVHERVRRVPEGYDKLRRTFDFYALMRVNVQAQCTVSKVNVFSLDAVESLLSEAGIDTIYRLATSIERLHNSDSIENVALDQKERSFFADFLLNSGIIERTSNPARRLFYRQLVKMLVNGAPRRAPCYYQNEAVLLSSRAELFQCSIVADPVHSGSHENFEARYFSAKNRASIASVREDVCSHCPHDQAGAWSPAELAGEVWRNSSLGAKLQRFAVLSAKALRVIRALLLPSIKPAVIAPSAKLRRVVIVGCYGGEHVGDAAILGGVLFRLAETFQTQEAVVLSSRTDRTRSLISGLETPVKVTVRPYEDDLLEELVDLSDALVVGGGPLMDLPDLLARHIRFARRFAIKGLPTMAEGVGYGPFRRRLSRQLAHRLIQLTGRATLRSEAALNSVRPICSDAQQTPDPAFDYLSIRRNKGTVPVSILAKRVEGKPLIAINLRPLWKIYASRNINEGDIRKAEVRIVSEIVKLVQETPDMNFLFVPLNSDQFGMSDLKIGHSLEKKAAAENLTIWEAEPSVDDLLATLQVCDAFFAMRFHACIFGLSAECPTFGIDYGVGQATKVAELFNDFGLEDRYCDVSSITAARLKQFLHEVVPRNSSTQKRSSKPCDTRSLVR